MFVLPALTTLISLGFAAQVLNQYRARGKTYQLAWGLALLFYAVGAFAEVMGSLSNWTEIDFRIYYLFGAILLVPWLALGTAELLLQAPRAQWARLAYRVFVALVTVLGLAAIASAALHDGFIGGTHVPDNCAMYCPHEHGYALGNILAVIAAAVGNTLGTVVLVVGAGYSAVRASPELRTWSVFVSFRPLAHALRDQRTLGNLLILAGSLVVAGLSTLTRLGHYELFYAGQAAGIAIIFAGFHVIGTATQPRTQLA